MAKTMEPTLNVNEVSRISSGTVIKGEVTSPNDIRIDGSFEGKINSKGRVVVGENAVISGDIICDNVDFWGRMTGSLFVRDTLTLKEGCTVTGDLHIKRLVVELGARFDGNCHMLADGDFEKLAQGVAAPKQAQTVKPIVAGTPINTSTKPISGGIPVQN